MSRSEMRQRLITACAVLSVASAALPWEVLPLEPALIEWLFAQRR